MRGKGDGAFLSVSERAHPVLLFKNFRKIVVIGDAAFFCDLMDGQPRVLQQAAGLFQPAFFYVFGDGVEKNSRKSWYSSVLDRQNSEQSFATLRSSSMFLSM